MKSEMLSEIWGGLKWIGRGLRPEFTYSATQKAKDSHDYTVENPEKFNWAAFGTRNPKVHKGDTLLCLGNDKHGNPQFMLGITGNDRERPTENISTRYIARGPIELIGLALKQPS